MWLPNRAADGGMKRMRADGYESGVFGEAEPRVARGLDAHYDCWQKVIGHSVAKELSKKKSLSWGEQTGA
jgi:hypothetical protein